MYTETSSLRTLKIGAQKPQQNCTFMNAASGMCEVGDRTWEYTVPGRKGHLLCLPPVHTESSGLRTLKIMPRNLNKIERSWIRLQVCVRWACEYSIPGRKGHLLCLPPVHTALAVKQVFNLRNSAHRHPSLGAKLSGFWPRAPPALSVLTSSIGSLIGDALVISCVLVVRPTGRVCVVQGWGVLQGRPLPVVPTLLIFSPVSLNVSIHRERYNLVFHEYSCRNNS
jgi:hypothetical protein